MNDTEKKKECLKDYLAHHGLKTTKQREAIANIFFESKEHLSLTELYSRIRKQHPEIGFATVYRTIKLFEQCGLAASRYFGDTEAKYEQEHRHDHLICTQCGKIVEFRSQAVEAVQEKIARRHGFKLHFHKHELYGICSQCSSGSKSIVG